MNYQIKLKHTQVTELSLTSEMLYNGRTNDVATSFEMESWFNEENKYSFAIFFAIILENKENGFFLKIKSVSHFEADKEIDDEFMRSSFVKISAPAIAFPYLRTFISNLTLNSGYEPIILPSLNFVKIYNEENNK